jgi:hypothetical protein
LRRWLQGRRRRYATDIKQLSLGNFSALTPLLKRLREKPDASAPLGLKSSRRIKNKRLIGMTKVMP